GALMHDVGVVVSFNSDSSELARRMNTEAAKAVRYGGLDPQDALNIVTINPARQLRIDHRTGSLEVGKDADFVIWSESPLSTYARCEQTWIEGARYFDLNRDRELRASAQAQRQRLIQRVLREAHGKQKATETDESATPLDPTVEGIPFAEPDHPDRLYSCCWRTNQ
ncbi:MAG: amidohydrolase family protein, partial [Phycisphaerales bacterium]